DVRAHPGGADRDVRADRCGGAQRRPAPVRDVDARRQPAPHAPRSLSARSPAARYAPGARLLPGRNAAGAVRASRRGLPGDRGAGTNLASQADLDMSTRATLRPAPEHERVDLHIHLPTRTIVKVLLTLIVVWAGLRLWPQFVSLLISLLLAVALHPVVTALER